MTGRHRLAIIVWLVGLALCALVIAQARFSTDMSAFLPRHPTPEQQVLVDQLHDGAASRLILLGLTGAPPDALASLSQQVAKILRANAAFTSVTNGAADSFTVDQQFLWQHRYALSPLMTPQRFTVNGLRDALTNDLQLLGSDMAPLVKHSIAADPTGEIMALAAGFMGAAHPAAYNGVWFSADRQRAVLLVQTRAAGFDIDAQTANLAIIDAALVTARQAVPAAAGARLLATGPAVFAVHSRDRMKRDTTIFSTIATMLVSLILLAAYRSPRQLILALVPMASGALAGIAAVALGFGFVHGITLGFGVTLIGEAVDYAIYLFTQNAPGVEPPAAFARIWPTLRLGLLTSVCGFSAMLFSGFIGFAQLGLFTIAGLLTAAAVTRFILPLLMPQQTVLAASRVIGPITQLHRQAGRLRPILGIASLLALGFIGLHHGALWQDDIAALSPLSPPEQALDKLLRQDIQAPDPRYLIVAHAASPDAALTVSETLAAQLRELQLQGALAGFEAPSRLVPSLATQTSRRDALLDTATLAANLETAQQGLPFRPSLFDPFLAAAAAAKSAPPLTRQDLDGTGLALKYDALLMPHNHDWNLLLPLRGVTDAAAIRAAAQAAGGLFIDLKQESDALLAAYRREAVLLSLAGSGAIVVLLFVVLRSPRRVGLVLAPLATAVVVTTALLLATGPLSIFNLFGLLLTVAVGSNYCLFFEQDRRQAGTHGRTVASLVLANLCTLVGFGILSFSPIPVLHGIGGTVAIGAFLSLVFGAVLIGPGEAQ